MRTNPGYLAQRSTLDVPFAMLEAAKRFASLRPSPACTCMSLRFFIAALVSFAAVYLALMIGVLARRKPGYRHWVHTISELGEVSATDRHFVAFVAFGVFLPVGLMLLVAAGLSRPLDGPLAALAGAIAVGYLVAAIFPCDVGSPVSGTPRQAVHNAGGAVEYIGGGFALFTMAETLGPWFKAAGAVVLIAAVALTLLPARSVRGLIQRIAETVLFVALLCGILLLPDAG